MMQSPQLTTGKSLTALFLLFTLYWTQNAQADIGFFIGANAGYSDIEWDEFKDDQSAQVYIGYNLVDWLGIEIGATDFGSFDVEKGNSSIDVKANHITLDMTGDFGRMGLQVFAKIGVYDADLERTCSNCAGDTEESSSGLTYAAGLSKELFPHVEITGSWQNYYKVEDTELNLYQIGLKLTF